MPLGSAPFHVLSFLQVASTSPSQPPPPSPPPSPPNSPPPPPPAYLTNTEPTGFTLNAQVGTLIDRASSYGPLPNDSPFVLSDPSGMVYDRFRNKLIWSNAGTHEIYEVDNITGIVSKLAGTYRIEPSNTDDGDSDSNSGNLDTYDTYDSDNDNDHFENSNSHVGTNASFYAPAGLALSSNGQMLIVADMMSHQIRAMDMVSLNVYPLCGFLNGSIGSADGQGTDAGLYRPYGLALTKDNQTLYISEVNGHRIRKFEFGTGTARMPPTAHVKPARNSPLTSLAFRCIFDPVHGCSALEPRLGGDELSC